MSADSALKAEEHRIIRYLYNCTDIESLVGFCSCIGKGFLAHFDPFALVNTDEIAAFTGYLVTIMSAKILDDSVFPAV